MQITALHHIKMVEEVATLRTVVSSAAEFVLELSPNETFWVEVVDELVVKFLKLEERHEDL
jgi:hypothetical protein